MSANSGTGPTLIIWWTAGVSGIDAPAIRAIRGLQTPQAMTTVSARDVALVGPDAADAAVDDVDARRPRCPTRSVSAPISVARSRMIVPARSESTTPTPGVWKPPRMIEVVDVRDERLDLGRVEQLGVDAPRLARPPCAA